MMTGTILRGVGGFYYIQTETGDVWCCRARGIFRRLGIRPLPGDTAAFEVTHEGDAEGNITDILPRRSELLRPAVANADLSLAVFAMKDPEPSPNLIDRVLLQMKTRGLPVILCFQKRDLAGKKREEYLRTLYAGCGAELFFVSAATGEGTEELAGRLTGHITVMAGPSGVGKSTLLNNLCGTDRMETGVLSEKIRRGRHTTRYTEMFPLPGGGYLFDTPGFGSLMLPEMEPEELSSWYPEFEEASGSCRFAGCVHMGETDCGVKNAVRLGTIPAPRYQNYRIFFEELEAARRY